MEDSATAAPSPVSEDLGTAFLAEPIISGTVESTANASAFGPRSEVASWLPIRRGVPVAIMDEFNIYSHVMPEIVSRLPIHNVEWTLTSALSQSLPQIPSVSRDGSLRRIISRLKLDLIRLTSLEQLQLACRSQPQYPTRSLDGGDPVPILCLYFLHCEDAEVYKQVVRKQIRQWVDWVTQSRPVPMEWFIVHVDASSTSASASTASAGSNSSASGRITSNALARQLGVPGGTVSDRIRADFNNVAPASKRDRVLQLRLGDDLRDEDIWREFFGKVVDSIFSVYGSLVLTLADEIRTLDAGRIMPGFNYFRFFMAKESLITILETVHWWEEALMLYDELEMAFMKCIDTALQKNATLWIQNFGASDPMDDSASILSSDKKNYINSILDNAISVFDFRSYLFSRQAHLMARLNAPVKLLLRSKLFISMMTRWMVDRKETLGQEFISSWIYSASMEVVNFTEAHLVIPSRSATQFDGIRAELLHDARRQMDIIARRLGYLVQLNSDLFEFRHSTLKRNYLPSYVTNRELIAAFKTPESFCDAYIRVTNRAIASFVSSGAFRTVRILKADIALLHFSNGDFGRCLTTLRGQIKSLDGLENEHVRGVDDSETRWKSEAWTFVDIKIMSALARCHKELQQKLDYVQTCFLIFLRHSVVSRGLLRYCGEVISTRSADIPIITVPSRLLMDAAVVPACQGKGIDDLGYNTGREIGVRIRYHVLEPLQLTAVRVFGGLSNGTTPILYENISCPRLSWGTNWISVKCAEKTPCGVYRIEELRIETANVHFKLCLDDKEALQFSVRVHESEICLRMLCFAAREERAVASSSSESVVDAAFLSPKSGSDLGRRKLSVRIYTRDSTIPVHSVLSLHCETGLEIPDGVCTVTIFPDLLVDRLALDSARQPTNGRQMEFRNSQLVFSMSSIEPRHIIQVDIECLDRDWTCRAVKASTLSSSVPGIIHHVSMSLSMGDLTAAEVYSCSQAVLFAQPLVFETVRHPNSGRQAYSLLLTSVDPVIPIRIKDIQIPVSERIMTRTPIPRNIILCPGQTYSHTIIVKDNDDSEELKFNAIVVFVGLDVEFLMAVRQRIVNLVRSVVDIGEIDRERILGYVPFLSEFIFDLSAPTCGSRQQILHQFGIRDRVDIKLPPLYLIQQIPKRSNRSSEATRLDVVGPASESWIHLDRRLRSYLFSDCASKNGDNKTLTTLASLVRLFFSSEAEHLSKSQHASALNRSLHIQSDLSTRPRLLVDFTVANQDDLNVNSISKCRLSVHLSKHSQSLSLFYKILEDADNWMIVGQTCGHLSLEPGQSISDEESVQLVPLRPGFIIMPPIFLYQEDQQCDQMAVPFASLHPGRKLIVRAERYNKTFWISEAGLYAPISCEREDERTNRSTIRIPDSVQVNYSLMDLHHSSRLSLTIHPGISGTTIPLTSPPYLSSRTTPAFSVSPAATPYPYQSIAPSGLRASETADGSRTSSLHGPRPRHGYSASAVTGSSSSSIRARSSASDILVPEPANQDRGKWGWLSPSTLTDTIRESVLERVQRSRPSSINLGRSWKLGGQ